MTTPPNRRVLVVDDEPLLREALGARLRRSGFEVELAGSAEEAWTAAQAQRPSAVLLDICMPGVSGFEFLDQLRSSEATRLLPVILLSALSDTEHIVHGLERGASDYVVKPPSIPLLVARLNREIERYQHLVQAEAKVHEMTHLATHDPLTGLSNRRFFSGSLDLEFQRMRRYARPLSVLMLDLDEFKAVNDRHGHAVGDEVLRELAQLLSATRRSTDIFARYGGEEFCLLLPETTSEAAHQVAENIRTTVASHSFQSSAGPLRITVSIGTASGPAAGLTDAGSLLKLADDALYEAKRAGRNCVITFKEVAPTRLAG